MQVENMKSYKNKDLLRGTEGSHGLINIPAEKRRLRDIGFHQGSPKRPVGINNLKVKIHAV